MNYMVNLLLHYANEATTSAVRRDLYKLLHMSKYPTTIQKSFLIKNANNFKVYTSSYTNTNISIKMSHHNLLFLFFRCDLQYCV